MEYNYYILMFSVCSLGAIPTAQHGRPHLLTGILSVQSDATIIFLMITLIM